MAASGKVRSMDLCIVNEPCTPHQGRNSHRGRLAPMPRARVASGGCGGRAVVELIARPGLSNTKLRWAGSCRMPARVLAEPRVLSRMAGLAQPNWQTRSAIT